MASPLEKTCRAAFFLLLAVLFVAGTVHGLKYFIDYPMYERAGAKVLSGQVADLHELTRVDAPKFHYSFFFAFLFSAFAAVGPSLGRLLFAGLFCAAYVYILWTSTRIALRGGTSYAVALVVLLLSIYPMNDALMTANIGILLVVLSLVSFQLHRNRPVLAGIVLGAAIVIKIYPLLVLAYFVWARERKVVLSTIPAVFVFYVGLPALVVGPAMAWHLIQTQAHALSAFGNHWPLDCIWFQNFSGSVLRFFGHRDIRSEWIYPVTMVLAFSGVLVVYAPSFLFQKFLPEELKTRMFVLIMGLTPLLLPISWYNVGLYYCPVIAGLAALAFKEHRPVAWVGLTAFGLLYCLTAPDIIGSPWNDQLEHANVPFTGAVTLVGAYLWDTVEKFPEYFGIPIRKLRQA